MRLVNFTYSILWPLGFGSIHALHVDISRLKVSFDVPEESNGIQSFANEAQDTRSHSKAQAVTSVNSSPATVLEDEYIVELEYEDHVGYPTEDGKYIKFSNIPYAFPPNENDTRWAPPMPYYSEERKTNKGSKNHICPQFIAGWFPAAAQFTNDTLTKPVLPAKWEEPISVADYPRFKPKPELDPRSSEDCLLLDVVVPKKVWEKRHERYFFKAATIVQVHGGGFILGSKNDIGTPEGLLNAVNETEIIDQIIHVSINYRLGAFGFLGGEDYLAEAPGNLGLMDQEMALRWVNSNIDLFGGDTKRITLMGQSAGASSIMHHITAYAGRSTPPAFKNAIIQSPGFFPQPNGTVDNLTYKELLKQTGVQNFDELINVDTKKLMQANADLTYNSTYGLFSFGPTVDGGYVPDLPSRLLANGYYHGRKNILIGHTKFDGLIFTPPWIRSNKQLGEHVQSLFPGVPSSVLSKIEMEYPIEKFSFAKEKVLQVANFLDDISIQCNSHYLSKKIPREGYLYRYVFNIVPAIHGADLPYTYYPAINATPAVNADAAKKWQRAIVNFARYVDPNEEDSENWKPYQHDDPEYAKVMNFGAPDQLLVPNYSTSISTDPLNQARCDYWESAPYYHVHSGRVGSKEKSDYTLRPNRRPKIPQTALEL